MTYTSGLLSKTSESQYRLLTMEGEFLIEGNLSLNDGFHSNMDLSNVALSQPNATQLAISETFISRNLTSVSRLNGDECSECCDPDCSGPGNECTSQDD